MNSDGPPQRGACAVLTVLGCLCSLIVLIVATCAGIVYLGYEAVGHIAELELTQPSEGLEPQSQDYVKARQQFRTKLLRRAPAPQQWIPIAVPPDVQAVEYPSGNLRLKAWISRPQPGEQQKRPAVLFLHGGFAFAEEDWDQCEPFRQAGFVTMTPMLRGENGQPGHFTLFYDEVDDVIAAAEFLARQPHVDPNRVYVAGHSAGGTLAMLAALTSKRFKAAASFAGAPDISQFLQGDNEKLAPFDKKDARELRMRSAVAYASSFKCPTRLYFGDQEGSLQAATARTARLAKEARLDVDAVEVLGDHLGMVDPAIRKSIEFFKSE